MYSFFFYCKEPKIANSDRLVQRSDSKTKIACNPAEANAREQMPLAKLLLSPIIVADSFNFIAFFF